MIRVPAEIQVRIIRPQPEESVPHFIVKDVVEETRGDDLKRSGMKILSGGIVGVLLGMGIFLALNICGVSFGNVETSMILGLPCFLGIMASYVIF